jgi:hypothetical protein
MSIINKIGLEAEYLLRDASGALVYPSSYGLESDSFPILGEIRGAPGKTRQEAIAHFLEVYYRVLFAAKAAKLTLDINTGWTSVTPAFHAEVVRKQSTKEVAQCKNVYNTDILERSDAKIIKGKVVEQRIGAGLHVHFSSQEVAMTDRSSAGINVSKTELEAMYGTDTKRAALYANLLNQIDNMEYDDEDLGDDNAPVGKQIVSVSQLCKPAVDMIVKSMDRVLLPPFVKPLPDLKYRLPGFYEVKPYGFEYRSLPFNRVVLESIHSIVDHSFGLLESL